MPELKIYTTAICPFCDQAKALFRELGLGFTEIRVDQDPHLFRKLSRENNGWRTVPMIFIGDEFLGGYTDVYQLHVNGGFLPKVQAQEGGS